jgi:hypothetical protein
MDYIPSRPKTVDIFPLIGIRSVLSDINIAPDTRDPEILYRVIKGDEVSLKVQFYNQYEKKLTNRSFRTENPFWVLYFSVRILKPC